MLEDQLGCILTKRMDKNDKGARRFRKVMIAEAMYMLWLLRCEWRISRGSDPETPLMKRKIVNRLRAVILKKIKMNCLANG